MGVSVEGWSEAGALMSGSTAPKSLHSSVPVDRFVDRARDAGLGVARAAAFWAAVLLPLAYVPALHSAVGGHRPGVFLGLLLSHAACSLIGRDHSPA